MTTARSTTVCIATRGATDYLLVYNYTSRDMKLDLRKISGEKKKVWWMNAGTGKLTWLGEYDNKVLTFRPHKVGPGVNDGVLIAIDSSKSYLSKEQQQIDSAPINGPVIDRNE